MKIEKMTIPPFLTLELQLLESVIATQKKSSKETREEMRQENRNVLKSKIENLIKRKAQKMDFATLYFEKCAKLENAQTWKRGKNEKCAN